MRIETALAKAALDAVARRDPSALYHKMTPAELQKLTPAFDWATYFKGVGAPPIDAINVTEPEFFKAFDAVVSSTPVADLKTYLPLAPRARVRAPCCRRRSSTRTSASTGRRSPGRKSCSRDGGAASSTPTAISAKCWARRIVKEAFGPAAKEDTLKMVRELEASMEPDINSRCRG